MDRRGFLKTTGTLIAGATLAPGALAEGAEELGRKADAGRTILPMNREWLYSHSAAHGSTGRDFDDTQFDRVVVPHTNIKLPWHSFDDQDYEFVSIYRRHFKLPPGAQGSACLSISKA